MNCRLKIVAKDIKTGITEEYNFTQTKHCLSRSAKRAIDINKLKLVITYGEPYYKQGLIYYVLGATSIPEEYKKDASKLMNTVAIVDGSSDTIITCYRSKNGHKHIKIKQKRNKYALLAA